MGDAEFLKLVSGNGNPVTMFMMRKLKVAGDVGAGLGARPATSTSRRPEPMSYFSLALTEEQQDLRNWVHGFAAQVVRPAAAEWDEREETPWPVIQEAARIGLYGFESLADMYGDPSGLSLQIANEELFWGDAGIGMALFGTSLAVAGIFASGTPDQFAEWVPQCYGDEDDPKVAAFCVSEPRGRLRRLRDAHAGPLRRGHATSGCSPARRRGSRTAASPRSMSWSPRSTRRSAHAARPRSSCRPAPRAWRRAARIKKLGLRASHTADVFLDDVRVPGHCLLGGKEKLDARLARAREGGTAKGQAAMATFEVSRPTVGAQALGIARAAYEYALEYAGQRGCVRPADHREPVDRVRPGRHAYRDRGRTAADLAGRVDGPQRPDLRRRPGLDVQAPRR